MGIAFSSARWEELKENTRAWWAGELKRPLIQADGPRDPGRPAPALPRHQYLSFYGLDTPADRIIDRIEYDLSCREFLGEAFPFMPMNFGPGVLSVFLGAELRNAPDTNTVWFEPAVLKPLEEISFDGGRLAGKWLDRIRELGRAAAERWEGLVQIGMPSMWGNLDLLSTFRTPQQLLTDLYDSPAEVTRLVWEGHEAWWRCFQSLDAPLRGRNPGYSCWTSMFCEEPWYMLQCDFCAMIGPDMFDEFVKPELEAGCRKLSRSFYHLDGPGQLVHLDSVLSIPELDGVQWIPGTGQPDCDHWSEVYRKIRDAGKKIQMFGDLRTLDAVAGQLGSAEGIALIASGEYRSEDIEQFTKKWG